MDIACSRARGQRGQQVQAGNQDRESEIERERERNKRRKKQRAGGETGITRGNLACLQGRGGERVEHGRALTENWDTQTHFFPSSISPMKASVQLKLVHGGYRINIGGSFSSLEEGKCGYRKAKLRRV